VLQLNSVTDVGIDGLSWSGMVHPLAACFPMLEEDELNALAADIAANGLRVPIVLDRDGNLVDGRNRMEACRRADVKPHFTVLPDGEIPELAILSFNSGRRHLSGGQRAMMAAVALKLDSVKIRHGTRKRVADAAGVDPALVTRALLVVEGAPELVEQVTKGGSLNQAYEEACKRRDRKAAAETTLASLRVLHPDLANRVDAGDLTLDEATAVGEALTRNAKTEREIANVQKTVVLLREAVGPEIKIRAEPDLSLAYTPAATQQVEIPDPAPALKGLKEQKRELEALLKIRNDLRKFADEPPAVEGWDPEGHVIAIRDVAAQIVDTVYAIVERYNAAGRRQTKLHEVR